MEEDELFKQELAIKTQQYEAELREGLGLQEGGGVKKAEVGQEETAASRKRPREDDDGEGKRDASKGAVDGEASDDDDDDGNEL